MYFPARGPAAGSNPRTPGTFRVRNASRRARPSGVARDLELPALYDPRMGRILRRLKKVRLRSLDRGDHAVESEHSVENPDALAATGGRGEDPAW